MTLLSSIPKIARPPPFFLLMGKLYAVEKGARDAGAAAQTLTIRNSRTFAPNTLLRDGGPRHEDYYEYQRRALRATAYE
jgi:hypothetical protein